VCHVDGSNLKVVANDEMVSHCYWYDDSNIFAYLRDRSIGDNYYLVDIHSTQKKKVGKGGIDLFGDGHPSVHGNKILFDTYPDKSRMKHLFIYNVETANLNELGEFYESFDYYGETRCDLHPRFSFDGKKVFFDSVHEGKRNLYMMNI
jgi:Tol biopolymer transport system component